MDTRLDTEASPGDAEPRTLQRERARRLFRRSLHVFALNAGSCGGCETELAPLLLPPYSVARHGIAFVDSPHRADLLLVSGVVTSALRRPLLEAYDAMPAPKLVAAIGACPCSGGIFRAGHPVDGPLDRLLPVDLYIPGCPPTPRAVLHGLLLLLERQGSGRVSARHREGAAPADALPSTSREA